MSEYYYLVTPMLNRYETRHAAVGEAALFERDLPNLEAIIVPVERGSVHEDVVDAFDDQVGSRAEFLESNDE